MRNNQYQILNAVDTASQTSAAVDVGQAVSLSFCPIFGDATAAGTVKIQCSNDNPSITGYRQGAADGSKPFVPTNWSDVPSATSTIASGVGPAIVIPNACFSYIRVVYTRASGGSTTVIVNMNILSI